MKSLTEKILAKTLFDKLWDLHVVARDGDEACLVAIDRIMLHERTGGVALRALAEARRAPVAPERIYAVMDHIVSFREGRGRDEARFPGGEAFITETRELAQSAGLHLIDTDDARQGIVHVIAPEQGIALPGLSIICPDSHTCSLGALGALAIGVGSGEAEHAMATGVMRIKKPRQMQVRIDGALSPGVTAKDLALHIISTLGAGGARRCAVEYSGKAIKALDLEERLTLCNLAVEFGAFTSLIAPDEKVFDYIKGRPYAPGVKDWNAAYASWHDLYTDPEAEFDHVIDVNACDVSPMISWGTSPEQCIPLEGALGGVVPSPGSFSQDKSVQAEKALAYMDLAPSMSLSDLPVDGVFIGSCTNGRLSDLRAAASVLVERKVAPGVRAVCVPGSRAVQRAAEAEGLDEVFKTAGFEWGAPGCAMCFYAGGETFPPGARVVSSTNRNFEGRQGPGVRTHLASPATAAASAVAGKIISADHLLMLDSHSQRKSAAL